MPITFRVLDVNQDELATFDNAADADRYADALAGAHVVPSVLAVVVRPTDGPSAEDLYTFIVNELDAAHLHARVSVEYIPVSDAAAQAEAAGTGACPKCGSLSPWRCGCDQEAE